MRLAAGDCIALEQFPLAWRWTDPRRGVLPPDVLAEIHPLRAERAGEIAERLRERERALERVGDEFFRADDPIPVVRQRLEAFPIAPETRVVISWDEGTAVLTEWGVFAAYWDRFCYPRADDAAVVPVGGAWVLRYHRYEVFWYSRGEGTP